MACLNRVSSWHPRELPMIFLRQEQPVVRYRRLPSGWPTESEENAMQRAGEILEERMFKKNRMELDSVSEVDRPQN